MSNNPTNPAATNRPILPPSFRFPFVDPNNGVLSNTGMQILQQIYTIIAGSGGLVGNQGSFQLQLNELTTVEFALLGPFRSSK